MLGRSGGREALGTRGPPAENALPRRGAAPEPGPGSQPRALAWLARSHGGARRGFPRGVAGTALSLGLALKQEALLRHLPFLGLFGSVLGPCKRVRHSASVSEAREARRWAFERVGGEGKRAVSRGRCV